ncbi:hypothetical protein GJAV_G00223050 [Gymnothorax javanicus]|nr:hypothetical protein GJAV_G00223050 [Gymnothorax javanicus]
MDFTKSSVPSVKKAPGTNGNSETSEEGVFFTEPRGEAEEGDIFKRRKTSERTLAGFTRCRHGVRLCRLQWESCPNLWFIRLGVSVKHRMKQRPREVTAGVRLGCVFHRISHRCRCPPYRLPPIRRSISPPTMAERTDASTEDKSWDNFSAAEEAT